MLRVIDLDQALKDRDNEGIIFTLTVGTEKLGISSDEVAELIKAKALAPARGGKRTKRAAPEGTASEHAPSEEGQDVDHRPPNSWTRGA